MVQSQLFLWPLEFQYELIGLSADRRIKHGCGARIRGIGEQRAGADVFESRGHDFLLQRVSIDSVQGPGIPKPGSGLRRMIEHNIQAARLQRIEYELVEPC